MQIERKTKQRPLHLITCGVNKLFASRKLGDMGISCQNTFFFTNHDFRIISQSVRKNVALSNDFTLPMRAIFPSTIARKNTKFQTTALQQFRLLPLS
jgi:hypothetical protein